MHNEVVRLRRVTIPDRKLTIIPRLNLDKVTCQPTPEKTPQFEYNSSIEQVEEPFMQTVKHIPSLIIRKSIGVG